jgi:hypothetical protein
VKVYAVVTLNGVRLWHADDADHAEWQHQDAFAGEEGENIIEIYETIEKPLA